MPTFDAREAMCSDADVLWRWISHFTISPARSTRKLKGSFRNDPGWKAQTMQVAKAQNAVLTGSQVMFAL